jgi:hypothetical protein
MGVLFFEQVADPAPKGVGPATHHFECRVVVFPEVPKDVPVLHLKTLRELTLGELLLLKCFREDETSHPTNMRVPRLSGQPRI